MAPQNGADGTTDFPEIASIRAFEYKQYVPESQANAAAMRDLGYTNKQIAEALNVTGDAASSYYSKFTTNAHNAPTFVLATFGGPKSVRSWQMIEDTDTDQEYWYIVKPLQSEDDLQDAKEYPPEGEFVLVTVQGTPTSFEANSTRYPSLDEMADAIYRDSEFSDTDTAQEVHGLLTEAGLPTDTLADPRSKLE